MRAGVEHFALDANIILRYLLRDNEELWSKAKKIFKAIDDGRMIAHLDPVILAEVVFVMNSVYKLPRQVVSDGLKAILSSAGIVTPNKDRYLMALSLFLTTSAHFGDACACAAAIEECDGNLLSFDRKLSSVEGIHRLEAPP